MDSYYSVCPTPVDEIDGDDVSCAECGANLADEAYFDGDGAYYCEPCMDKFVKEVTWEAKEFAEENCRITEPLPRYDPENEYRCTPEEYQMGARESYTPNSHMSHCRHNCTNYDELIAALDRDSVRDRIYYTAINVKITELLQERIETDESFDEDE